MDQKVVCVWCVGVGGWVWIFSGLTVGTQKKNIASVGFLCMKLKTPLKPNYKVF